MNTRLVWSDEYNIGVDIIDKEHKRLFKIINKLFAFGDEKKKANGHVRKGSNISKSMP